MEIILVCSCMELFNLNEKKSMLYCLLKYVTRRMNPSLGSDQFRCAPVRIQRISSVFYGIIGLSLES